MAQPQPSATTAGTQPPAGGRRRPSPWLIAGAALSVVAAMVLLVVVLTDTPGARIARSVDATMAQGSARTTITGIAADLPILGDVRLSVAEGEVDLDAQTARLERELPFLAGVPLPGLTDVGTVELVFAGGDAWVRPPVAGERSWVKVTEAGRDAPLDEPEPAATAPGLGNPLAILGLLRAIEGTPDETGEEDVEGVTTTRYRVLVDVDAVRGQVGEESEGLLDGLERLHPDGAVPMDVWIDDDDLIRQVAYEGEVDLAGLTQLRLGAEVTFDDFGTAVDIAPPSDDEVVDVSPEALRDIDPLALLLELVDRLPGR